MESNVCLQVVFYGEGTLVLLVGGGLFSPGLLSRGFGCNFSEIKRFGDSNEIPTDCREKSIEWSGGCGEAENTHRDPYISSSMHTHTHTLQTYKNTPGLQNYHTHILQILVYPSRTITDRLSVEKCFHSDVTEQSGLNGPSAKPEKITSVVLLPVSTAESLWHHIIPSKTSTSVSRFTFHSPPPRPFLCSPVVFETSL